MIAALWPLLLAAAPVCPVGTVARAARVEDGTLAWCALPDGTWSGPFVRWWADGSRAAEGAYLDGEPSGHWTIYHPGGVVARSGEMAHGQPVGAWQTWRRDGEALWGTVHGALTVVQGAAAPVGQDPRVRWERAGGWLSAARLGGRVVALGHDAIEGFDLQDGAPRWRLPLSSPPLPGIVVDGDRAAAVLSNGQVVVVDAETQRWTRVATARQLRGVRSLDGMQLRVQDTAGRTLRVDLDTGEVLERRRESAELPADEAALPPHQGGSVLADDARLCLETPEGALSCREDGDLWWTLPGAGRPVGLAQGTVLALSPAGSVAVVSPAVAATMAGGDEHVLGEGTVDGWLDATMAPFGPTGVPVQVPLTQVGFDTETCQERVILADLSGLAPSPAVVLEGVEVTSAVEDGALGPAWRSTLRESMAEVSYWYAWSSPLLEATPRVADPEFDRAFEQLQRCEIEGLRFEGSVLVGEDPHRRRYDGAIELNALPHRLDDAPSCLIELRIADHTEGLFAGALLPAWMDLHVDLWQPLPDGDPLLLPPLAGDQREPGDVLIETLLPYSDERSSWALPGPVWLGWDGARLDAQGVDGQRLSLVLPGLQPAALEGQPAALEGEHTSEVPTVTWTRRWDLWGTLDAPGWRVIWSECREF